MIEVCEKKNYFFHCPPTPPKLFLLASPVLRFLECYRGLHRISSKNMHPFGSYDILNICSVFLDIKIKLKMS